MKTFRDVAKELADGLSDESIILRHPSIICPRCGLRSYHPRDIEEHYCGRCHDFHENMREATMPNWCFDCGAYLMGGATVHKQGCSVQELIDQTLSDTDSGVK